MVVEGFGRELETEFVLEFHEQIDRHGGIEPELRELGVHVDSVFRNPQDFAELIDAERGNFVFCHALHPQTAGTIGTGGRMSNHSAAAGVSSAWSTVPDGWVARNWACASSAKRPERATSSSKVPLSMMRP